MFKDRFSRLQERYELTNEELGRGNGIVFRARDRVTGRSVAIKLLNTRHIGTDTSALAERQNKTLLRFERGGEIQLMLSGDDPKCVDPNLVFVHAYGLMHHEGRDIPALVMDFCLGKTLHEVMETGTPLPLTTVVDWGRQIASVLFRAGARGVIHRDLKPPNIMIVDAPHGGLVKVLDFDIARFVGGKPPSHKSRPITTDGGRPPMTASYASPEQRRFRPLGPQSDLYSFGVLLSDLLNVGFDGTTSEYTETLPQALRELIDQLLAIDPDDRPQDAMQVYQALTRIRVTLDADATHSRPAEMSADLPISVRGAAKLSSDFAGLAVELTQRFSPMHPDALEQRQWELRFAAQAGKAITAAEWNVLTRDRERATGWSRPTHDHARAA